MLSFGFNLCGAGRGNRTPTVFPPADFESAASTNSAIPAIARIIPEVEAVIKDGADVCRNWTHE